MYIHRPASRCVTLIRTGRIMLFFNKCVNVAQVASLLVIIETVTQNEIIRNLHCDIFHIERNLKTFRFEQKSTDVYGLRIACSERFYHAFDCQARFHDVLNNYHRASGEVFVYSDNLLYLAGRCCAPLTTRPGRRPV